MGLLGESKKIDSEFWEVSRITVKPWRCHPQQLGFRTPIMMAIWGWVKTLVPLVNPKIAGKWMFIPLRMVLIGIDPYPYKSYMYPQKLSGTALPGSVQLYQVV